MIVLSHVITDVQGIEHIAVHGNDSYCVSGSNPIVERRRCSLALQRLEPGAELDAILRQCLEVLTARAWTKAS